MGKNTDRKNPDGIFFYGALFALMLLAFFIFSALPPAAFADTSCVTNKCHATLLKGKDVHPVAEQCDTCHQPAAGSTHPQKGKKTFPLTQEPPALCATCHDSIGKKKKVHPPVKDGMCTTCHNPHSSDEPKLLQQPLQSLCTTCHTDKQGFKYMHGPASTGDCTMCHSPHDSDSSALALQEQPGLCFNCHTDIQDEMKHKNIHPALQSGCTACHNPHGSSFKKFFAAEGAQLCFQCHPNISEKVGKAKVVHPPVKSEKACASCHSPHASDTEKLLHQKGKDLCLGCHKNIINKNDTVLHGPIKQGTCTPCHDPHAAQYAKLLINSFPDTLYVSYTDDEYKLCFSCHNRDLLRFPDTSFATGFRNGDKNLHYIHVNRKEKGRSCIICHTPHGGDLPKLLRNITNKIAFGKWNLPLKFKKTDTGGSCTPGCHQTYYYDRKKPVKTPEMPPEAEHDEKTGDAKDKEKK